MSWPPGWPIEWSLRDCRREAEQYGVVAEKIIFHCYKLAKFYGVDPDVFLDKPISRVMSQNKNTDIYMLHLEDESKSIDG